MGQRTAAAGACRHRPRAAARQAARTPAALAVAWNGRRLTFRELAAMGGSPSPTGCAAWGWKRAAVGLACRVRPRWWRPPRHPGLGGAYLPLDPAHPPARQRALLAESGAVAVAGDAAGLAALAAMAALAGGGLALPAVTLDDGFASLAAAPAGGALPAPPPASHAYVHYTSGSSGRPKGVMVPHAGLSNYLAWCDEAYAPAAGSGSAVHSPLGFDLTVTGLLEPLLDVRAVWLVAEEAGLEGLGAALAAAAAAGERFGLVKLTPAHLELLRQPAPAAAAAGAATWVIGGEALSYEALAPWRAAPTVRLINEYGPTETVVGSTIHVVGPGDPASGGVPIGRPIRNTSVHLLDRHGRPVAPGVTGEIHLGGSGVARGYAGAPDQTAERFVPNPAPESPGERLYRTGDLGRFRASGELDFLGRADAQIKLRGFRIEPAEIERVVASRPAIRAAVIVRGGGLQPGESA